MGKWRRFFWPVYGHEHRRLIPMFFLFFLISFVYNTLRCIKVTLIVTAPGAGTEVLPFLKVWGVLPGAILLTFIYTKLLNRFNREIVFYIMISLFLGFFLLFVTVLLPNSGILELSSVTEWLTNHLPVQMKKGLHGLIMMIRYWHFSTFYVLSELWSAMVLSVLFWGFANEVTTVHEAKRFYAIFALGANSSGILSGQWAQLFVLKKTYDFLPFGMEPWEQSLILQVSILVLVGIFIMGLFYWMNHTVFKTEKVAHNLQHNSVSKEHLSLFDCFAYLLRSRYLLYIAIIVVAYNLVYNLSDIMWTERVRQQYLDPQAFNAYMNHVTSLTGLFATISALLLSGNVIRHYGWTTTALLTPMIWLVMGMGFFGCLFMERYGHSYAWTDGFYMFLQTVGYNLALLFGSAQMCLGRAAKFSVFDESKEIAFIPLSQSVKRKGKAVIDGIVSRFGKSGSSILIQALLIGAGGEIILIIPYVFVIFCVVIALWIYAVFGLGRLVKGSVDKDLHPNTPPITL